MITNKVQEILHNNIDAYNLRSEKDYLLCFSVGKNHMPRYYEISIRNYNYWHLLGCKLEALDGESVYNNCINKQEIAEYVSVLHPIKTIYEKERAFKQVFDFVRNAKSIRIGHVENSPEQFVLQMAMGNDMGIIGYDYPKNRKSDILIPVSCQEKRLGQVVTTPSKILFILSKNPNEEIYNFLEYEVKNGLAIDIIKEKIPAIEKIIDIT